MPAIRMRRVYRYDTTNTPVTKEETFPSFPSVFHFHRSWRYRGSFLRFGGIVAACACGVVPGRFGIGG